MKKWVLLYFVLCLCTISKAQNNLVPNWSFEEITSCPTGTIYTSELPYASPWQNPSNGTPDLFGSCDKEIPYGFYGVPNNSKGYQLPHSGENYCGAMFYYNNQPHPNINTREYIQIKIIDSLQQNQRYCMTFYLSLADSASGYAISNVGAYISQGSVTNFNQYLISETPQILNPINKYLINKKTWTPIQGMYTAAGGENYITIGNFYDDNHTDTLKVSGGYNGGMASYYYLDDVSLVEYTTAYAGIDTNICKGLKIPLGAATTFGASYTWSVLSGSANSIDSTNASQVLATPTITTTYVLQKQQCGISSYDTVTVYVKPTYTANAGADTTICIGDAASIGVNNCTNCTYTWQNIASPYTHMPVLNVYPLANTVYTLALQDSCFTTYSNVTVNIEYCQSPVVSVPNIFTPNADGINDTWQLVVSSGALSIINYQCAVYDRWGVKVFDSSPPLGITNGWDGRTTSGLSCSEGTYYYVISYTDAKTNEQKNLKGFLELIR